jgi:hypothetical protein
MRATTSSRQTGTNLRDARERANLTRAQLAAMADCSIAQLANIEWGAVPRHSKVLHRAWSALDDHEPAGGGLVEKSGGGDARDEV